MDFGAYFKESKITLSVFLARLLTVVFVLLTVVGVVYNSMNQEFCGATKADRNWTDQNGNAYDVTSFQDQGDGDAIYYQMPEISYDQVLFFRARNMFVDVYVDDVLVYQDERDIFPLYGTSPGTKWHVVNLPVKEDGGEIKLVGYSCFDNAAGRLDDVYIGDVNQIFHKISRESAFSYLLTLVWMVLGIVFIILYAVFRKHFHLELDFLYLGTATFLAAVWCSAETHMWQFYFGYSSFFHFVGYISLFAVMVMLGLLAELRLEGKWHRWAQLYTWGAEFITLVCLLLHLTGIFEFHYTINCVHVFLLINMPLSMKLIDTYSANSKSVASRHLLKSVFALLMVCAVVGIMKYISGSYGDYARFIRLSLLFFLLILMNSQLNNMVVFIRKGMQSELQHEFALTDHLTKFYNRAGFSEHMGEYEKILTEGKPFAVIQFDVNNLKQVNDNQGHEKGDELICLASSGIYQSFGMVGKCYRMGGDEFQVILTCENAKEVYEQGIADLETYCGYANSMEDRTFDVRIAHGFAEAKPGNSIRDVQDRADVLMYQKKRQMKATEATTMQAIT